MSLTSANPPIVLSFSTLDPSGAGGLQADIETAASLGCHCAPIATSFCSTGAVPETETLAMDPPLLIEQARSILENMDVKAIKIGFLGTPEITEAVHSIVTDYPNLPVVSHPALCLLEAADESYGELIDAYTNLILPLTTVANFSLFEAQEVAKERDTIDTTAHSIISHGCQFALITGTGKQTQAFQNSTYSEKGLIKDYYWQQEPPACHGSSTTLATATASYLAHGFDPLQALEQAQNFTWHAMQASRNLGFNNRTPHRFYWADKNITTSQEDAPGARTH